MGKVMGITNLNVRMNQLFSLCAVRSLVLLILSPLVTTAAIAQGEVWSGEPLPIVWGGQNHKGSEDLSVRVMAQQDRLTLTLTVDVIDDRVVWKDDPEHSDHVEVWIAQPGAFRRKCFLYRGFAFTALDGSAEPKKLTSIGNYPEAGMSL